MDDWCIWLFDSNVNVYVMEFWKRAMPFKHLEDVTATPVFVFVGMVADAENALFPFHNKTTNNKIDMAHTPIPGNDTPLPVNLYVVRIMALFWFDYQPLISSFSCPRNRERCAVLRTLNVCYPSWLQWKAEPCPSDHRKVAAKFSLNPERYAVSICNCIHCTTQAEWSHTL